MTSKPKEKTEKKESFEDSLARLEDIVRRLESGQQGLEDALKLFEEGAALSKQLQTRLEDVKERVEILVKEGKDKLKSRPLEEEDTEE